MVVPVVVIHRNRSQRLERTLAALAAQTIAVRIVLVDSGSSAVEHERAMACVPDDTVVLHMGGNGGFGPSANAGFRSVLGESDSQWMALCPHDALPAPDALERMIAAAEARDRAGLACADFGDGAVPVVDPYFGGIQMPALVDVGWEAAGYPHGTLLLASRGCLEDVGLFDERYFAYGEEVDLGIRARAAGWEVGLVRGARVDNPDMSTQSRAVDYLMLRNTLALVRRYSGRYHATIRLLIALGHLVTERRRGPYFDTRARLRAMVDFLRGRHGPPPPSLTGPTA